MCSFCARGAACRLSRLVPVGKNSPTRRMALRLVLHRTRGHRHRLGEPTFGAERKALNHLCRRLRPFRTHLRRHAELCAPCPVTCGHVAGTQRPRGSCRPTPCRRLSGTSISAQSASQMSRGGVPSSRASSAVRPCKAESPRSFTNEEARAWNSVSTARRNSLRRITHPHAAAQCSESWGSIDATRSSGTTSWKT